MPTSPPWNLFRVKNDRQKNSQTLQIPLHIIRLALQWPSIASQILSQKLSLLSRESSDGESIGCQILAILTSDSLLCLMLVQECLSLDVMLESIKVLA